MQVIILVEEHLYIIIYIVRSVMVSRNLITSDQILKTKQIVLLLFSFTLSNGQVTKHANKKYHSFIGKYSLLGNLFEHYIRFAKLIVMLVAITCVNLW